MHSAASTGICGWMKIPAGLLKIKSNGQKNAAPNGARQVQQGEYHHAKAARDNISILGDVG